MNEQNNQLLIEYLKSPDYGARLSDGGKWLYWECTNTLTNEGNWIVLYSPPYARKPRCLYSGEDLGEALKTLAGEAQE